MAHVELSPELQTGELPPGTGSVFRNRGFGLLWSAQVLSQLASNMVLAALMTVVVRATSSNTANAVLILTFLVPAVVFSALAGVLVERSDARLIMLGANVLRAVGTLGFIFVGQHVLAIYVLNFLIATVSAFFAPAELTAIPRIVPPRNLLAANSIFVVTVNAAFGVGFGLMGPLLLTTVGPTTTFVAVAVMFALAAVAIIPLPAVRPTQTPAQIDAGKVLTAVFRELNEGVDFVRRTPRIAWSLIYLGVAASLIGVLGALGPGFAKTVLGLRPEDIFFVMGPVGLGAVMGILFLNSYGKRVPRRLVIDIGLVSLAVTLVLIALVRPIVNLFGPALRPIEENLPAILAGVVSLIALVVVIGFSAGVEYAFVAIPAQTVLTEELPTQVRGRIFGILNTLLSVASFVPVILAPVIADLLNIVFPNSGIPAVLVVLAAMVGWIGIRSWQHNRHLGLHARSPAD